MTDERYNELKEVVQKNFMMTSLYSITDDDVAAFTFGKTEYSYAELYYTVERLKAEGTPCEKCKFVTGFQRCHMCTRNPRLTIKDYFEAEE